MPVHLVAMTGENSGHKALFYYNKSWHSTILFISGPKLGNKLDFLITARG